MLFGEGPQIKNIAADLNKLFRQGSLLNQSGQTVEGDSTADQGTSDLLAARDPVIQEISVGMSGEQSARYTVSGTPPLSLPNSLGKPLKAWEVGLEPVQDLHGYANPWPAGGGKNLLENTGTTQVINGVTFTVNADGTITVNGTATGGITFPINNNASIGAGNYVISGVSGGSTSTYKMEAKIDGVWGNNIFDQPVTKAVTTEITNMVLVVYSGATLSNVKISPMICLASAQNPTVFAPYANICPIHGTDKLNLFVEESYDQSATPKAVITLPYTVYHGTISDSEGVSRWGKIVLDGSENWAIGSAGEGFWTAFNSLVKLTDYTNAIICDKLKTYPSNGSTYYRQAESGITGYVSSVYPNQNWIYAKIPEATNATEFKAWLAANPITVVYELATPIQFSITATDIPTPTGTATTWATAEDGTVDGMEVTYVGKT